MGMKKFLELQPRPKRISFSVGKVASSGKFVIEKHVNL
jgi:hypothetical protein